ncbi:MAG: DMT family transporter, partial [Isosphaeraceae bacterium]|nr:DMT family transporter [Isosphaeraceae bacterium]
MTDEDAEPTRRREVGAFVVLGLMVLIGSTTATAAKFAVQELPAGLLPIVRFGGAGLCLLPWVRRPLWRMVREDGGRLLAAAAFCVPINQAFFLNGTRLAPTSHVGLIYAACPLVVLLLAAALGQERLAPQRLAGVLMTILGVVVIGLGNLWQSGPGGRATLLGDLLEVGAVVSWGAYLTVNKPLVARHGSLPALAGTFLLGSLLQGPIALATWPGRTALAAVSMPAWLSLAYLTLIVSLLGLACQNRALHRLDASQVAAVGNLAPILTVVWGVLLLGEP